MWPRSNGCHTLFGQDRAPTAKRNFLPFGFRICRSDKCAIAGNQSLTSWRASFGASGWLFVSWAGKPRIYQKFGSRCTLCGVAREKPGQSNELHQFSVYCIQRLNMATDRPSWKAWVSTSLILHVFPKLCLLCAQIPIGRWLQPRCSPYFYGIQFPSFWVLFLLRFQRDIAHWSYSWILIKSLILHDRSFDSKSSCFRYRFGS